MTVVPGMERIQDRIHWLHKTYARDNLFGGFDKGHLPCYTSSGNLPGRLFPPAWVIMMSDLADVAQVLNSELGNV